MEDNKEHCARQAKELSSMRENRMRLQAVLPNEQRERVGEGKWERVRATERGKEVRSYLNGAGSARGEGKNPEDKTVLTQSVGEKAQCPYAPLFCVSGGMWVFKAPIRRSAFYQPGAAFWNCVQ